MDSTLHRRRNALFVLFLVQGILIASWITRTPGIRDLLQASTSQMGMILFGLSLGSMSGVLSAARLVRRFSTRPVIALGAALMLLGIVLIALGAAAAWAPGVFCGLFCVGLAAGAGEIAINMEGANVERLTHRHLLPTLHGFFSLGTLLGALLGMALAWLALPVPWHLSMVALLGLWPLYWACRQITPGMGRDGAHAESPGSGSEQKSPGLWRDPRLLTLGLIVMAMALAEGSAMDWLPLLMVDGHGFSAAASSLIYVGFTASMAIGRLSGSWLLQRLGRVTGVRLSALLAVLGLALVIFSEWPWLAALAVPLWGLGACLGFPLGISAAGDGQGQSGRRVALVATLGYLAFLAGPPVLGFLGQHYGLRSAMLLVLVLVAAVYFLAPAVAPRR